MFKTTTCQLFPHPNFTDQETEAQRTEANYPGIQLIYEILKSFKGHSRLSFPLYLPPCLLAFPSMDQLFLKKIRSNLLWTTLESNQGRKLSHRFVSGPSWVTDEAQVLWRPALKDTCARGQGVGSNFHILLPQSSQAGPGGAALGDPHTQPEPWGQDPTDLPSSKKKTRDRRSEKSLPCLPWKPPGKSHISLGATGTGHLRPALLPWKLHLAPPSDSFSTAFSLLLGSVSVTASSEITSCEPWFCCCHRLVYLCLRVPNEFVSRHTAPWCVCLAIYTNIACQLW